MNTTAEVKMWGTSIGAVTLPEGQKYASFEYNPSFVQTGIQVSPITMPLGSGIFRFPNLSYESFFGLPGFLADSLPDKFGNQLINAWLSKQGRLPESFNAVEKLCYTGNRGMGALEFYPLLQNQNDSNEVLNVQNLVELASLVLQNRQNLKAVLDECDKKNLNQELAKIIKIGTSAGGARAKAVIAFNPATKEVRSGQVETEKGFEHWLIKFSGVSGNKDKENDDELDFGLVEYAYYLMAKSAGIDMNQCYLLDDGKNQHFMTKRFDRTTDGKKLHMQTLAGLCHFDFNQAASNSYEQVFSVMNRLELYYPEKLDFFKRMIFNVMACNCDDHVKNVSFLMDKTGKWKLAPFYDVCFAYNPAGKWTSRHQMTINGKTSNFIIEDFNQCAKIASLRKKDVADSIYQVKSAVSKWQNFAEQVGVRPEMSSAIQNCFVMNYL